MIARQFSVRCTTSTQLPPAPSPLDLPAWPSQQLVAELTTSGLEEVIVVPDAQGETITVRGRATSANKEAARTFVEDAISAVTLDLIILEPGVWVDERIGDHL